ncbi:MAG: hypothetical protein JXQ73_27100, partial [Phycisphaerae bacterium]|nr:hypothetical protein [Phycisphaerae bacterium]
MRIGLRVCAWGLVASVLVATPAIGEQADSPAEEGPEPTASAPAKPKSKAPTTTTTSAPARRPPRAVLPNLIRPVGFGVLCGWILACLYFASWGQLKSGVPPEQRATVNLFLLVTGPVGWVCFEVVRRNPKLRDSLDDLLSRVA